MLANGRAFLLLAAVLTVTRARRKQNEVLAGDKDSTSLPGLPAMLNPSPAAGRMCPLRPPWHRGRARRNQPGITELVLTGNTRKGGRRHIPGLRVRCQRNSECYSVMASAAEL